MNYFSRFKNVGTIIAMAGLVGMLLTQFGVDIDIEWLDTTIKIICNILIVLGICNNPDSAGLDIPIKKVK